MGIDLSDKLPEDDIPLPQLSPLMRLFKASNDREGKPRWSLFHPASNKYFYLNWVEFECLARFHKAQTAKELVKTVNNETTLEVDIEDVKALILFLQTHALVTPEHQLAPSVPKEKPLWERIVHGYLFFTVPIFKPESFLKKTLPYVQPLLTKGFIIAMLALLVLGVLLTAQRFDEFFHTFLDMFSVKGAIITGVVFTAIKIVHEMAHAYVATKHGVRVPHMGAAFIVMYPVLYTEVTAAWQLEDKRKRVEIGLAGVGAELTLAAIALMMWNILPPGIGQSIAFGVVAISLIGSLLVNLNPMMRFDGYFVLSDALNIENLHARAIGLARWKIREALFALGDPVPEDFGGGLQRFMIAFGFSIIIYRFFLFLGIALMVYAVFLKPLGLILMVLELLWFIALPAWGEVKVWWRRREDIWAQKRARVTLSIVSICFIVSVLPVHSRLSVQGVYHADQSRLVFAPSSARIQSLNVQDGQVVEQGEILAELVSPKLERDLKIAESELENLQNLKRRQITDIELYRQNSGTLDDDIEEARLKLEGLFNKRQKLNVTAPFDGVVKDLSPEIHAGRSVSPAEPLFTIIDPSEYIVSAYVSESQLKRLEEGAEATFFADFSLFKRKKLILQKIDPTNVESIKQAELASLFGGDTPSTQKEQDIVPLSTVYEIQLKPLKDNDNTGLAYRGEVHVSAKRESIIFSMLERAIGLFVRESGLN